VTRKTLTGTVTAVNRAVTLPPDERPPAIAELLYDLRGVARQPDIGAETRINLLTKAARGVDPSLAREPAPASPAAALRMLEQALSRAGLLREPGQPGIGPTTKVALPDDVNAWLDQLAAERGRTGIRARSSMIRAIVIKAHAEATNGGQP